MAKEGKLVSLGIQVLVRQVSRVGNDVNMKSERGSIRYDNVQLVVVDRKAAEQDRQKSIKRGETNVKQSRLDLINSYDFSRKRGTRPLRPYGSSRLNSSSSGPSSSSSSSMGSNVSASSSSNPFGFGSSSSFSNSRNTVSFNPSPLSSSSTSPFTITPNVSTTTFPSQEEMRRQLQQQLQQNIDTSGVDNLGNADTGDIELEAEEQ
jgi:hypothetical protein